DGALDFIAFQASGPPLLLRNDQQLRHHWVRLQLAGSRSHRDAIGAWVKLTAGGQTQWRQVMPTRSYLSQSELPVTFGLGNATAADSIEFTWPGGVVQKINP